MSMNTLKQLLQTMAYWKSPAYVQPLSLPLLSMVTFTVLVGFCAETAVKAIVLVPGTLV
jgi:hypothetical protein